MAHARNRSYHRQLYAEGKTPLEIHKLTKDHLNVVNRSLCDTRAEAKVKRMQAREEARVKATLAEAERNRGVFQAAGRPGRFRRALLADGDAAPPADFLLCATAPLAPQLASAAEARFAAPLYEIYGCSEAGQVASRRTTASEEWRCLDGITLRQDERGSWAAGGSSEAPILLNDIIELRGEGLFLLHGRTADLVNIAGKRTSLAHLNFHLNSIPGVRDGVFVMPPEDGEGVTRLTAFVVAPGLAREAILAALRQHIDAVFLPRPLHIVASLPRNSTGKLPREAIDKLAAEFAER